MLVLDEGFVSGAATAIGLRDAGCPVTVLAAVGGSGGHRGRALRWTLAPRVGDERLVDAVAAAIARDGVDVVYPVTEPLRGAIAAARPDWEDRVWPRLERWQLDLFGDKRRTSAFVAARGVAVPEQRDVDPSAGDAELAALGLPVVVKGSAGRGGSATCIAPTVPAARRAVRRLAARGGSCFLQRWIAGPTWLAGGVFDGGRPLRWYAGAKRVQHPPRTGPAAVIESVHDAALDDAAARVFAAMGACGLASADFVRDADGRYLFLELNPRPWGSLAAAREAGVDLFTPLAALLAGEHPAPREELRAGVRTAVLPLCLASPRCWASGDAARALRRDLPGAQGAMWREPGQAAHLLARLGRAALRWAAG